jgi:hypothetical protein
VILMQPVLEIYAPDGFDLWPVVKVEPFSFLPLSGDLTPAELGTAVMGIANYNDIGPDPDPDPAQDDPPRSADPLESFLHGLLTRDDVLAAGGLRVTDSSLGITFLPGCCNGLEEWRDWREVVDGSGQASFGHDPAPFAECLGDTVRLTVDAEQSDSPVIELSVAQLRHLLAGAEDDLTNFLSLAADWVSQCLPDHAIPVTAALARALDLPAPAEPSKP